MTGSDCQRWAWLFDRETLGEVLDPAERGFLGEHAIDCATCAAERDAWGGLRERHVALGSAAETTPAATSLSPAVNAVLGRIERGEIQPQASVTRMDRRSRVAVRAGAALASLAAAAALILWLQARRVPEQTSTPVDGARLESSSDSALNGTLAKVDALLKIGDRLETRNGGLCVRWSGGIRSCLAPHSRARVVATGAAEQLLALDEGRVAVKLDKQAPGHRFSIRTRDVQVTAVGTFFSVQVRADRPSVVSVWEGVVRVSDLAPGATTGNELALVRADERFEDGVLDKTSLGEDDQRVDALLLGAVPASSQQASPVPPATSSGDESTPVASGAVASERSRVVRQANDLSAEAMLQRARHERAAGKVKDAIGSYEELIRRYPASSEGQVALVSLGDLYRSVNQPEAALRQYDRYLARGGGTLSQVARSGKIHALRALHRDAAERRMIEEELRISPTGVQADALKSRLHELTR